MKEARPGQFIGGMCQGAKLELIEPAFDLALLKLEFDTNADKEHLKGLSEFPHLTVSSRELDEGEPVYSFGYPLSDYQIIKDEPNGTAGFASHCPRTTSAVVASTMDTTRMVSSTADPKVYVLDKALNYGNSGGPIVSVDTGHVHALCSRFQPVHFRQPHIKNPDGSEVYVRIPSLYGVVSALHHPRVLALLRDRGITVSDD
jgi:serine protease Do